MRESYTENLASYAGAESYADGGDTVGVATAGGHDDSLPEPSEATWQVVTFTANRKDGGVVDAVVASTAILG